MMMKFKMFKIVKFVYVFIDVLLLLFNKFINFFVELIVFAHKI